MKNDPFARRGMHLEAGRLVVRAVDPSAQQILVLNEETQELYPMAHVGRDGQFEVRIAEGVQPFRYRLVVDVPSGRRTIEDPYRFGPVLGELDVHLMAEGAHLRLWERLGANRVTLDGVNGVAFAVWAPNARRASVVGDFNDWDGRRHPMRFRVEVGVWEIFIPELGDGVAYKFELESGSGALLPLKADPLGREAELRPKSASIINTTSYHHWNDRSWMEARGRWNARRSPVSIYEAHLGSWRRGADNRFLSYRELAETLIPYVRDMGFTHVELMPVMEHPFDGSWGYQPIGLYAPTSRHGTPDDFRAFVDRAHAEGIGVVLDWVPGHFPADAHGLAQFDGTALYEYADPRKGFHPDWRTFIYNFSRREVANFLLANGLYWFEEFHADALRVDAVASMLYLNYSRKPGEWEPNRYGGNENLEAIDFIRRSNETVYAKEPGAMTIAEESTAWPMVSAPVYLGGLGYGFKWNMGWMHDMLDYLGYDPIYRSFHHQNLTFGIMYAWSENFVLPLSHDEVVHGKGSLLRKMPGDDWQRFANLRLLYGLMFAYPGKKLLFMGNEFAQWNEWDAARSLDWNQAATGNHAGTARLVRDLNAIYRGEPALHELDNEPAGFAWIDHRDHQASVIAFERRAAGDRSRAIVVVNATPVVRSGYRIGAPRGEWRVAINTDSEFYGGSNAGSGGGVATEPVARHGYSDSLALTLPPLGTLILLSATTQA